MKHRVFFDHQPNSWDCALPLGNGVFGCMQYFEDSILHTVMNHYEIYYNISNKVLPKDQLKHMKLSDNPGALHREVLQIAKDNEPQDQEPFCTYGRRVTKEKAFDNSITLDSFYSTYNVALFNLLA